MAARHPLPQVWLVEERFGEASLDAALHAGSLSWLDAATAAGGIAAAAAFLAEHPRIGLQQGPAPSVSRMPAPAGGLLAAGVAPALLDARSIGITGGTAKLSMAPAAFTQLRVASGCAASSQATPGCLMAAFGHLLLQLVSERCGDAALLQDARTSGAAAEAGSFGPLLRSFAGRRDWGVEHWTSTLHEYVSLALSCIDAGSGASGVGGGPAPDGATPRLTASSWDPTIGARLEGQRAALECANHAGRLAGANRVQAGLLTAGTPFAVAGRQPTVPAAGAAAPAAPLRAPRAAVGGDFAARRGAFLDALAGLAVEAPTLKLHLRRSRCFKDSVSFMMDKGDRAMLQPLKVREVGGFEAKAAACRQTRLASRASARAALAVHVRQAVW